MIRRIALSMLLAGVPAAAAPALPDIGFANLSSQHVESVCVENAGVHFDATLAHAMDQFEADEEHPAGGMRRVLEGRLAAGASTEYVFKFDDGASCDPQFTVWRKTDGEYLGSANGENLVLPGNGFFYIVRATNRSFESREKWAIENGALVEVSQPFHYVGIATKTLQAFPLHADASATATTIAQLPRGESVTVVLHQSREDRDWYLVRTRFGLLGWTQDSGYGDERKFADLVFRGD